uniref:RING-type domain-containing protein n=1 Tax=Haptolina brevifila TaxID=156173 RepID=A0A7S2E026_9EUKA|mmetsp:Transcript_4561/g.9870  ORF Transcript_4561/g.9870 Transcript_4561/m.9870 type:complete len:253 (+) Transcript_4561:2-760(+)
MFCPTLSPNEILRWLVDPVLLEQPAEVPIMSFQLTVPREAVHQPDGNVSFPTTLMLPNGRRIGCRQRGGPGTTISATVPLAALQQMGQWSLEAYHDEDADRSRLPILQRDLSRALPVLSDDHDQPKDAVCAVCTDVLCSDPMRPLRKLPCTHCFHASCIDTWLTTYERSCPTCRASVLPMLLAAVDAIKPGAGNDNLSTSLDEPGNEMDGAWEQGRDERASWEDTVESDYQAALQGRLQIGGQSVGVLSAGV